jgi:ketopantoate reductase
MTPRPRILLVGAGAVGQVFAHFLRSAGADLAFLVKEQHAEAARRGFMLYPLGVREPTPAPVSLAGFDIHVSMKDVARERWDQVWLCVSSPALRTGDWVARLAQGSGDATWVMLQPALDDRDWLLQWVPEERLVQGMIPFLSFHAPLTPEEPLRGPGTAFWLPPLSRGAFSGPETRLHEVLTLLRAGHYPAQRSEDVTREASLPTAVLTAAVLSLEAEGWSFERLLKPEPLERLLGAAREAARIAQWATGASPAAVLPLLRPFVVKAGLALATRLAPLPLETFLRVHFTKVGEQSRAMLRTYLSMARSAQLDVPHLRALAPATPDVPASPPPRQAPPRARRRR